MSLKEKKFLVTWESGLFPYLYYKMMFAQVGTVWRQWEYVKYEQKCIKIWLKESPKHSISVIGPSVKSRAELLARWRNKIIS